ncbi:TadE/TadG family type IV pilus assembly protein [Embleya sp. MST-111070]|uniref:TadE/TadG family type IV pilus assembly protein n=1 Tax=Embleya sp. MST-111070 TaxID=3398231 RepID=UPI003F735310
MTGVRSLLREDRGAVALETAILVPVLAIVIGLLVAAGRITVAGSSVDAAAKAAAREASIARNPYDAVSRAEAAARRTLSQHGMSCAAVSVRVDTTAFAPPTGPARVRATVRCTVNLSDAAVPGMPGTKTMESTVVSPVDRYRDRSLGPASESTPTTGEQL